MYFCWSELLEPFINLDEPQKILKAKIDKNIISSEITKIINLEKKQELEIEYFYFFYGFTFQGEIIPKISEKAEFLTLSTPEEVE